MPTPDGDLYPPDAPNAAYWNHIHRTRERSSGWTLRRGETMLGTFTPAHLEWVEAPAEGFIFCPEPAFEAIRPLFDKELRLLNEEWEINDLSQEFNAVWEQIDALGLTLVDAKGWVIPYFILHIRPDNRAWFQIAP